MPKLITHAKYHCFHPLAVKLLNFLDSKLFIFLVFLLGISFLSLSFIFFSPLICLLFLFGLLFIFLLYKIPEISIFILIILNVTFFNHWNLPRINLFGGASLLVGEVLVLLTFAILIIRNIKNPSFFHLKSFFLLPYTMLFLVWGFAIYISLYYGNSFTESADSLRKCFYHIIFFLVILTIHHKNQLKNMIYLLYGLGVIVTFLFSFMVLFDGAKYFTNPIFSVVIRELRVYDIGLEITSLGGGRICTDGPYLVSALFFAAFTTLINTTNKKHKIMFAIFSILFLFTTIITFGRMLWLTTLIGLFLLFIFSNKNAKLQFLKYATFLIVFSLLFSIILSFTPLFSKGKSHSMIDFIQKRFASLFTKTTQEESFKYRYFESKKAIEHFKKYPLFGTGFPYSVTSILREEGDLLIFEKLGVGHSGYLDILCSTGIFGLLVYLYLSFYAITIGLKYFHLFLKDPILYGVVLGLTINYIRIMLNATSQTDFFVHNCGSVIALSFGLIDVAIRIHTKKEAV
ncbi:MAG: O-antigen ligase family protein [bacterium]|nr:O-antigen ligase family protein [bacterium]